MQFPKAYVSLVSRVNITVNSKTGQDKSKSYLNMSRHSTIYRNIEWSLGGGCLGFLPSSAVSIAMIVVRTVQYLSFGIKEKLFPIFKGWNPLQH